MHLSSAACALVHAIMSGPEHAATQAPTLSTHSPLPSCTQNCLVALATSEVIFATDLSMSAKDSSKDDGVAALCAYVSYPGYVRVLQWHGLCLYWVLVVIGALYIKRGESLFQ